MNDARSQDERLLELMTTAEAVGKLAEDEATFRRVVEAFRAQDAVRFEAELTRLHLFDRCRLICRWLCTKHCVITCIRLCGVPRRQEEYSLAEIREFARVTARIASDESVLKRFVDAVERDDAEAFGRLIAELKLERFCHQICHWLCAVRCRLVCRILCPPLPFITRVGSIPISQIGPQGFGNGESLPPAQVPFPNPAAGVGDHPFGGGAELRGVFNMPPATQYLVEVASNPAGPYTPITEPVRGYNFIPVFPFIQQVTRVPSGGVDPGWFNILDTTAGRTDPSDGIPDSNGGPNTIAEKRLLDWTTASVVDGIYYLRLRVRDGGGTTRVSSPQVVHVDNTPPPMPAISLRLRRPDGTAVPLKCGKVRKGDGLIEVTIHAFDARSFSRLNVAAQGNSGLSVPVVDTSSVPLSKTYNGNLLDPGYPVPTTFLWDPWSDPRIVPCCYVVRVDIWDRAVLNNHWAGGHGNSGWEAIEIGF